MTETERKTLVVDESGAGDYRTLTEAVAACAATPDEPVRFYIRHGIYEERPFIELADYVIEGEYRNATVITASVGGRDPWPGEVKTGTFRSATLFLGGGRAVVRNLTVQNNAGDGAKAGQALAVYADASRVLMENVNLYGNQDTLFTAPLPLQEREKNGFRGPRENTPRLDTVQYYKNCTIRGNIDFIFGGANAVFDACRLEPWHLLYHGAQHARRQARLPVCELHRAGQLCARQRLSGPPLARGRGLLLAGLRVERRGLRRRLGQLA